jgi:hypothetical protein
MNPNRLLKVSITLSIIAISLGIANLLLIVNPFQTQVGKPSFYIEDYPYGVYPFSTFTRIRLENNGTATAHNIQVDIIAGSFEYSEFIPELSYLFYYGRDEVTISVPIGTNQLRSPTQLYIYITCNELPSSTTATTFHFNMTF